MAATKKDAEPKTILEKIQAITGVEPMNAPTPESLAATEARKVVKIKTYAPIWPAARGCGSNSSHSRAHTHEPHGPLKPKRPWGKDSPPGGDSGGFNGS